ncbi:MAG: helix-turn-helix transcriptional regulator [Weeksellaceae bacterium]|nr:helix-turn-helix transcriptional regulator [Weeksellaceae bacterium]
MDNKQRIEAIMNLYRINATELADKLGVQRSGISHIISGRNNPSLDFLMKLKESYPLLRWDFLIYGQLPMEDAPAANVNIDNPDNQESLEIKKAEENRDLQKSETTSEVKPQEKIIEAKPPASDFDESANRQQRLEFSNEFLFREEERPIYHTSGRNANFNRNSFNNEKREYEVERILFFYTNGTFKEFKPQ